MKKLLLICSLIISGVSSAGFTDMAKDILTDPAKSCAVVWGASCLLACNPYYIQTYDSRSGNSIKAESDWYGLRRRFWNNNNTYLGSDYSWSWFGKAGMVASGTVLACFALKKKA
ncbi:MAG: hypothetical protein WCE21_03280 [Candidatus Babeliales bacterium]